MVQAVNEGEGSKPSAIESPEPEVLDLDEALNRIGLGWGQQMSMAAMSMMWIGENMQLFAMFYLPQALKDDWGTEAESIAWVDTALFVGVALGALIGGECSDRLGRKPTVLWSALLATLIGFYNAHVSCSHTLGLLENTTGHRWLLQVPSAAEPSSLVPHLQEISKVLKQSSCSMVIGYVH